MSRNDNYVNVYMRADVRAAIERLQAQHPERSRTWLFQQAILEMAEKVPA